MDCPAPFGAGCELVLEAYVGERPAHHDLVVAAPRPVLVEVLRLDPLLLEVAGRRAILLDGADRRDVVSRDRVAEERQDPGARNVLGLRRRPGHALKVGRLAHVGRSGIPLEELAFGRRHLFPALVAFEDVAVLFLEHLGPDRPADLLLDLFRRRPDVFQVDGIPFLVVAERLVVEVQVHPPRQRVGDDERGRGEIVGAHLRVNPPLEVPVAGENGHRNQIPFLDRGRNGLRKGAAVTEAGGAAVADEIET